MAHTITITLSEAAQRAAIIAEQPAAREQSYEVEVELLPRLLALPWTRIEGGGTATCVVPRQIGYRLCDVDGDGAIAYDAGPYGYGCWSAGAALSRPPDAAEALAHAEWVCRAFAGLIQNQRRERAQEREERVAQEDAEAHRWAALPLNERAESIPHSTAAIERVAPEALAAAKAERTRLDVAASAAKADADARRLTSLARLARSLGDAAVTARLDASDATPLGLLPEDEAVHLVTCAALPVDAAHGLVEFVACDARCDGASFRAQPPAAAGGLSAAEWATIEAIGAAPVAGLPSMISGVGMTWTREPRVHVGSCSVRGCALHGDAQATARRVGVLVRADLGDGVVVEREYGGAHRQ